MGTPQIYSVELAGRCDFLIQALYPAVSGGLEGDRKFGGNLGTTFLLAMAMPMLILPLEKILNSAKNPLMADDLRNDSKISARIESAFAEGARFKDAPFGNPAAWGYLSDVKRFNIGEPWPEELLAALLSEKAVQNAGTTDSLKVLKYLGRALSHGGVVYLNSAGRHVSVAGSLLLPPNGPKAPSIF